MTDNGCPKPNAPISLRQRINEAWAAYHDLMTGQIQEYRIDSRTIRYYDIKWFRQYIKDLEALLAAEENHPDSIFGASVVYFDRR